MSKWAKIALGLATLWPILYVFVFIAFVFSMMFYFSSFEPGPADHQEPPVWFFAVFALHFLTIIWVFGLLAFYIVNVFRNDRVEKDKKVLWAVVLFFGNTLAMPVYWYLYIWREPAPPQLTGTSFGR
jgi:hypothetical protein